MANLNTNNKMCIFDLYFYIWTKDNVAPADRGIFFWRSNWIWFSSYVCFNIDKQGLRSILSSVIFNLWLSSHSCNVVGHGLSIDTHILLL